MRNILWRIVAAGACLLVCADTELWALGGFGGGGFRGGGGGGGGGARPGGGGGSRPPGGGARPGGAPGAGASRPGPSTSQMRPQTRPSQPSFSHQPSVSQRPSASPRPAGGGTGLAGGYRPNGGLPGGDRPNAGSRSSISGNVSRPGVGARPDGNRAGAGNRPGTLPGLGGDGGRFSDRMANGGERYQNRGDRWNDVQNNRQDWISNRSENMQQRLANGGNWQENHQERWGNFKNDMQEHYYHNGWYGGHNEGYWGNYWNHMWSDHPVYSAFAVTPWGVGAMNMMFGMGSYGNAYYDEGGGGGGYDYSQPIQLYETPPEYQTAATETPAEQPADNSTPPAPGDEPESLTDGRAEFFDGKYDDALAAADEVLKKLPNDAATHEFRALCQFATGDYKGAAATLYAVLTAGPGWNWATLKSLYPDVATYTDQLRTLEKYSRANPDSADAHFVLGYHYLTAGHKAQATLQFQKSLELVPADAVSQQILAMLGAKPVENGDTPPPTPEEAPGPAVANLPGHWKAGGSGGTDFDLTLDDKGGFVWKYTQSGKDETVQGAYAYSGSTLVMEPEGGGKMIATLKPKGNDAFDFATLDAPPDAPPLAFKRS